MDQDILRGFILSIFPMWDFKRVFGKFFSYVTSCCREYMKYQISCKTIGPMMFPCHMFGSSFKNKLLYFCYVFFEVLDNIEYDS